MLQDFEEWSADVSPIILDIPGVGAKDNHTDTELKVLTLEILDRDYHPTTWTRAYADDCAENAVRYGGGGIFIKFPGGSCFTKSVATGQLSTSFRAEACQYPAPRSTDSEHKRHLNPSDHPVFLTDS